MPLLFVLVLAIFAYSSVIAARVLLALYALDLGAQPLAVGVLAATLYVFPMLLSWPVGALADRFGARWLFLFGTVSGAAGILVPYFWRSLPSLYVAASLIGLAFAFYNVLLQCVVGLMSEPRHRTQNFSNLAMAGAASSFIGPLVAGYSIDHAGHATACLYIATLSIAAAGMLVLGGGVLPGGRPPEKRPAGFLSALANREIWRNLALSSLVQLGVDLYQFYLPIYGHSIGLTASAIGVVLAMFAAASFVVRLVMPRLLARRDEESLLALAFFLAMASILLVPLFRSVAVLGLVSFAFGLGMGCGQPVTMMLMFSRAPEGRVGEALGLRLAVNNLMRVVGPVAFGSIGSAFGLFAVFGASAVLLGAGGILSRRGAGGARSRRR